MNESDAGPARLRFHPAPASLQTWLSGCVERDERAAPGVLRLLPELRGSLQVHHGARYWWREAVAASPWVAAPRVALWAPRPGVCLGHAAGRVRAWAVVLSPCGLRALRQRWAAGSAVQALMGLDGPLAQAIDRHGDEDFSAWQPRVLAALAERLRGAPEPNALDLACDALRHGLGVAESALAAGLSERQFRRRFTAQHGLTPKAYQRHQRVDRLLRRLHERPWETDPGPLHDDGFADQAHAIREFRAITGLTPGAYQRLKRGSDLSLRSVPEPGELPPPAPPRLPAA